MRVYKRRYGDPLIHSVFRNNFRPFPEREQSEHTNIERPEQDVALEKCNSRYQELLKDFNPLSKSYATFKQALKGKSLLEMQAILSGSLPVLWREFPRIDDLKDRFENGREPEDRLIYSDIRVAKARVVLIDFYIAWWDRFRHTRPTESDTLLKVANLTQMAKICSILRGMNQERLLDAFCNSQKTDVNLPLSVAEGKVFCTLATPPKLLFLLQSSTEKCVDLGETGIIWNSWMGNLYRSSPGNTVSLDVF